MNYPMPLHWTLACVLCAFCYFCVYGSWMKTIGYCSTPYTGQPNIKNNTRILGMFLFYRTKLTAYEDIESTSTYPEIGDGNFNITHSQFID